MNISLTVLTVEMHFGNRTEKKKDFKNYFNNVDFQKEREHRDVIIKTTSNIHISMFCLTNPS